MKNVILTIAFLFSIAFGFAQDNGITITVTVDNLTSDKGNASFSLHTANTFMKGAGIMNASSEIKNGKAIVTFTNVKPGEYAILGMHDANENGKMDFRENGMPLESFGTSNNVMAFGPPQYDEAKFKVEDKDLNLKIRF
jgi:uncharacterized protein (DUF2141 family)